MSAAQQGWICPRCDRGVSPLVSVCPCSSEGSAGVTAPVHPGSTGGHPGSVTVSIGGANTNTLYGAVTAWKGLTILNGGKVA